MSNMENFYSYFKNVSKKEIEQAFMSLGDADREFILKVHGGDLLGKLVDLSLEEEKRYSNILYQIEEFIESQVFDESQEVETGVLQKRYASKIQELKRQRKAGRVTDNIVYDFLGKFPKYKKISDDEQKRLIKIIKMSFYDDATLEEKAEFIEYFGEEYPWFKEKMSSLILEEEKNKIIKEAIVIALETRDSFIENNIMLVVKRASIYKNRGIPLADLIQEGTIGMLRALRKFDVEKNNTFSTYAVLWINQKIVRYIGNNARAVRIPIYQGDFINKIKRTEELMIKTGLVPTLEDLSKVLGVSEVKIEQAKMYDMTSASLDESIGDDDSCVGDFIADEKADFTEYVYSDMMQEKLIQILMNLNFDRRAKDIIIMHFGFDGEGPRTLEEIAEHLGITKQRARQIETRALYLLKTSKEFKELYKDSMKGNKVSYRKLIKRK